MSKITSLVSALVDAVRAYPHGVAIAANLAVLLAARFGLNLTADEIVAVAGAMNIGMAAFTRSNTVPVSLLKGK